MNTKRFNLIMLTITVLLGLSIAGAAYKANGLLQKQSSKLVSLKLDSKVAEAQQAALVQAKKDIAKYSDLEDQAKAIVPQDKDQAAAVKEIVKIANNSGIKLGSISFPSSTLGQSSAKAKSGTGSSSVVTKPSNPALTQVSKVSDIPGLYTMSITVQSSPDSPVSFSGLIKFLSNLEQNRHTAQVTGVTVTPETVDPSNLTFSLVINLYIKP